LTRNLKHVIRRPPGTRENTEFEKTSMTVKQQQ
jgi:hypothetical protein